jgi:hypothetical protein
MMKASGKDPDMVLHNAGWEYLVVPKAEESNYAITGRESQVVTLRLEIGDHCQAEPGVMMYLTNGMRQSGEYSYECRISYSFGTIQDLGHRDRYENRNVHTHTPSHLSLTLLTFCFLTRSFYHRPNNQYRVVYRRVLVGAVPVRHAAGPILPIVVQATPKALSP